MQFQSIPSGFGSLYEMILIKLLVVFMAFFSKSLIRRRSGLNPCHLAPHRPSAVKPTAVWADQGNLGGLEGQASRCLRGSQGTEAAGPPGGSQRCRVEKKGKKGKTNEYWHTTWRHGQKVCNIYLGSCKKLANEQALQNAMKLKAEDLGIKALSVSSNDVSLKMT